MNKNTILRDAVKEGKSMLIINNEQESNSRLLEDVLKGTRVNKVLRLKGTEDPKEISTNLSILSSISIRPDSIIIEDIAVDNIIKCKDIIDSGVQVIATIVEDTQRAISIIQENNSGIFDIIAVVD